MPDEADKKRGAQGHRCQKLEEYQNYIVKMEGASADCIDWIQTERGSLGEWRGDPLTRIGHVGRGNGRSLENDEVWPVDRMGRRYEERQISLGSMGWGIEPGQCSIERGLGIGWSVGAEAWSLLSLFFVWNLHLHHHYLHLTYFLLPHESSRFHAAVGLYKTKLD